LSSCCLNSRVSCHFLLFLLQKKKKMLQKIELRSLCSHSLFE
jgi:hypothetical protein